MKTILKLTVLSAVLLILAGGCFSCKKETEIPFTEYLLDETSCYWTNFELDKVIIVNNDEELRDYMVCADFEYSQIDFSKHSLLLVRGQATSGIRHIDISLLKNTSNRYTLNVIIRTNATAVAPYWVVSIITPKIDDETAIRLNVQNK